MAVSGTNIEAITQKFLLPKVIDTVTTGNILSLFVLGKSKAWKGRTMDRAIQTELPTGGGSFSGLDQFSRNKQNTKQRLSFGLRGYQESVVVEGMERDAQSSDPDAAVDLIRETMQEAQNGIRDGIADAFYSDGTGNSNKDFLGLQAIVDDGGEVATYGGLSRSTFTTIQGNEFDVTGSVTLDDLATSENSARYGTDVVTVHVTTETKFNEYEALHNATQVNNIGSDGGRFRVTRNGIVPEKQASGTDGGFLALYYRGKPVVADEKCPANKWFGLNMNHLDFYGVNKATMPGYTMITLGKNTELEGVYGKEDVTAKGFIWSGWQKSQDQYAIVGDIIVEGNLISWNPNRHFVINFS